MKLRYYLRGLGTGILVTALVLGRLIGAGRPLTDAEIRAKALTLGMVDENSLSLTDVGGNDGAPQNISDTGIGTSSPEPQETPVQENNDLSASLSPDVTDSPEPAASDTPSPTPEITQSPSPSPEVTTPSPEATPSPSSSPEVTIPSPESGETVTIVVSRGDTSYSVSRKLEEAGLVEDAGKYDAYLVDNGYSKTIRTGTYRIPVGASWKEIADIIA